ncbi:MAG TPA: hypothetical protein VK463_02830 [Desulfomonilaceae bacterium]|nr:hypothetical protein [Desulfomonilaceae bacterium]
MFLLKLIGMIFLGILSGILSYYNKNYYVRVFNDIMGTDENEKPEIRVGRGFLYGFFFPVYFVLLVIGLIALVAFLITAGIIAAVIFVLVWITEKILPHEFFGKPLMDLFLKFGLKPPAPPIPPVMTQPAAAPPTIQAPPTSAEEGTRDKPESQA